MVRILVVDDNENTRKLLKVVLEKNGYECITASDGEDAFQAMETAHIDLILLDVMMPRMDGYEFVKTIRSYGDAVPILMISAKDETADRIKGYQVGIDDYMAKPFNEQELLLRIQALLRRSQIVAEHELVIGDTVLKSDSFEVVRKSDTVMLPKKEFQLLFKLLSYPNKIFTRQQLMEEFWDMDTDSMQHTVDVHISRLRDRMREDEDFQIVTVRGLGYKAVISK